MNNYKLIENRPELTSSQVVAGMNFAAVHAGAIAMTAGAVGGKAVGAGLITKGFIAVLAVTSGLAVYKNYKTYKEEHAVYTQARENDNVIQRDKSKGPLLIMETISPKNSNPDLTPNGTCQGHDESNTKGGCPGPNIPLVNIDSLNALEDALTTAGTSTKAPVGPMQMVQPGLTCRKDGEEKTQTPPVIETKKPFDDFVPSPNVEAILWKPKSFCDPTSSLTSEGGLDCDRTEFDYVSCSELDGKGYVGVWLKVTSKGNSSKFKLADYLKNIALVRQVGDQCIASYPIAFALGGYKKNDKKATFIGNKTKSVKTTAHFKKYADIYLIFKDVQPGDKIIIEDFIMAKVVE